GIRDATVTGVQTCALPICNRHENARPFDVPKVNRQGKASPLRWDPLWGINKAAGPSTVMLWCQMRVGGLLDSCFRIDHLLKGIRSEERRVGREWKDRAGGG